MTVLSKLDKTAGVAKSPDDDLVKIVLPERRMIWLWIPKNAGSSLSRALLKAHKERAIACHIPLDLIWRLNPAYRDFEVVALKRNPYSRVVSCWFSKIVSPRAVDAPYFRKGKYAGLRHNMPFAVRRSC